jgi:hypothetical protein
MGRRLLPGGEAIKLKIYNIRLIPLDMDRRRL